MTVPDEAVEAALEEYAHWPAHASPKEHMTRILKAAAPFMTASPTDTARLLAAVKAVDEFIQDAAERSPRELIPVPTVAGLLRNVVEAELRGEA